MKNKTETIHCETLSEVQQQIYIYRNRMYQLWNEKHCIDPEILAVSRELDQLLNRYYLLQPLRA